jgi:hypothetical protein
MKENKGKVYSLVEEDVQKSGGNLVPRGGSLARNRDTCSLNVAAHFFISKSGEKRYLDATVFIGKLCAAEGVLSQFSSDT